MVLKQLVVFADSDMSLRLETVADQAAISSNTVSPAPLRIRRSTFEKLPNQLPEFTLEAWHGLVEYATVYAEDDIRFTFKNGQEVKS